MNKTHENPNSPSAGAAGSAFWLQHKAGGKNGRFILTEIGAEAKTVLETGSSVQVLRALKRLGLESRKSWLALPAGGRNGHAGGNAER